MSEGKDNENELSRKSPKNHDTNNKQDGGGEDSTQGKKEVTVSELEGGSPPSQGRHHIYRLEGLHLNPSTLPKVETVPKTFEHDPDPTPTNNNMKRFSRKKVGDKNSHQEENEPLKISILDVKQDKPAMEGKDEMERVALNEMDDDDRMKNENEEAENGPINDKEKEKLQFVVSAFTHGISKDDDLDLNKNASNKGDEGGKGGGGGVAHGEGSSNSNINNSNDDNDKPPSEHDDDPTSPPNKPNPVPFHVSSANNKVERGDSFTIATKDDVDAASTYSLYMEKDFRYHFQHPYFRLFCAYFVVFLNFFIYAEDPVAHSRKECNIPVIGNDLAFVAMRWPPNAWSLLKAFMWISGTLVGIIIGKVVIHAYLFNKRFRLKMFQDDKGSWMTMFLSTILWVFIFSQIYNLFLMAGGDSTDDYHITSYLGLSNSIFMKAAATGTWCGDFFTAWMVTDMMLQEKLYPGWARRVRKWWNTGIRRIVLFWIVVACTSFIVLFVIATDYINWDRLNRDFLHSNEISRAFLASCILVLDITIVMQDWDFPHFISAIDVKLPGVNTAHIRFKIPKLLKTLEYWHIHISGKWFNYGILFVVIILDLNMWKNQMFFKPYDYGQYVDTQGRIYTVKDEYSLTTANRSILSFDYRNVTVNPLTNRTYISDDSMMNARYKGYSMALKGLAFIPSIAIFLVFGILVTIYGRFPKPTSQNPYAGRLRKRRRLRFSARKKWNSLRTWISGSTPVLYAFRRRRENSARAPSSRDSDRDKAGTENSRKPEEVESNRMEEIVTSTTTSDNHTNDVV